MKTRSSPLGRRGIKKVVFPPTCFDNRFHSLYTPNRSTPPQSIHPLLKPGHRRASIVSNYSIERRPELNDHHTSSTRNMVVHQVNFWTMQKIERTSAIISKWEQLHFTDTAKPGADLPTDTVRNHEPCRSFAHLTINT